MIAGHFRRALACGGALLAGFAIAVPAHAQAPYPNHVIKLEVGFAAGGGNDIFARIIAQKMQEDLGQPVIVENRPGGDGIVAIAAFVKAHDDHVLLSSPTSSFTAHPFLYENLPYKPKDLNPIVRVSNTVVGISVPVSLNITSLKQLFELVRKEPGKLNWAGVTGALDFLFEGFLKGEGLDIKKVPYRNPVEAANDLAEGRVQVYESALAIARPQILSGKIRMLAVTNTERTPAFPDIPTVAQAGFPGLTVDGLVGLFGPADMPLELRARIADDVRAVADKIIAERLATTGQLMNIGSPDEFARSIDAQRAQVAEMARRLGVAEKK